MGSLFRKGAGIIAGAVAELFGSAKPLNEGSTNDNDRDNDNGGGGGGGGGGGS